MPSDADFFSFHFIEPEGAELWITNIASSSCEDRFGDYECQPYQQFTLSLDIPPDALAPGSTCSGISRGRSR